jgi:anaphase-promoting complex subunit 6
LKDLDSAIVLYEKCLTINPKAASTYTSLGFAHHLRGDFRTALNCYHKAHFLRHEGTDQQLTEELIQRALQDVNDYSNMLGQGMFGEGSSGDGHMSATLFIP